MVMNDKFWQAIFRSRRPEGFCKKGGVFLKKFHKIHWKTPVPESLY